MWRNRPVVEGKVRAVITNPQKLILGLVIYLILLVGVGIFFLHQSSLEKPNPLISWVDQTLLTLQKRARKNVDS